MPEPKTDDDAKTTKDADDDAKTTKAAKAEKRNGPPAPTIGRIVIYQNGADAPAPAIVTAANGDTIQCHVFPVGGAPFNSTVSRRTTDAERTRKNDDGEEVVDPLRPGAYWSWPERS